MSENPRQPRPDDAVLGGQSQAPMYAAVLGGIEGVKLRLGTDNLEEKKVALQDALKYGDKGIEVLFGILEQKESWELQWLAYSLLEKFTQETKTNEELSWWSKILGKTKVDENQTSNQLDEQLKRNIRARLKNHFPWYEFESVTVNRRGEIIKKTPGRAKYYREDLGNGVYLDMVYVAGGKFIMRSPSSEKKSDRSKGKEEPQHEVTVPSYWMGKYAVTQEQYQAIMGNNSSRFQGAKRPVEVSWDYCQGFCQKLSSKIGKDYRLPSEAEWEYGCRAGTTTDFHTGETITSNLANYDGNHTYAEEGKGLYREETVEVGTFPPNGFGLYEMHGNLWEWCKDGWHYNYRGAPKDGRAWTDNHSQTDTRVIRGGSWNFYPDHCRSAFRGSNYRDLANLSFRLVCLVGRTF